MLASFRVCRLAFDCLASLVYKALRVWACALHVLIMPAQVRRK